MITRRSFTGRAAAATASTLAAARPARAQPAAGDQILRVGFPVADVGTLDPHVAVANSDTPIATMIYEGLLALPPGDIDGSKLSPSLAERWESTPDRRTWTFFLRRGVRWHGEHGECTSDDVKFSIERVMTPATGSPFRQTLANIARVETEGPHTVRVVLTQADVNFPALMVNWQAGFVVSRKAVEAGVDLRAQPVGTGAFRFGEKRARDKVVLLANDLYWDGKPALRQVVYQFMPDNAPRELAMRSGDIDVAGLPARQDAVDRMRREGFTVDLADVGNNVTLHLNLTKKPIDDVRVRRALAHGIDRPTFVAYFGKDIAKAELSAVSSTSIGHTTDLPSYPHDVAKAKALLAEAGFPNGLTIETVCSTIDLYLPAMQLLQEQWRKIGVTLDIRTVDHPSFHRLIRDDIAPVVIYSAARYPNTAQIYLEQFFAAEASIGKPRAITNFSHYGAVIPGIDDLLDKARFSADAAEQKRLWEEAQRRIATDIAAIPLYSVKYALARTKRVDLGYEQKGTIFYRFTSKTRLVAG